MNVLLHICCGPCTIYPLRVLREEQHDITGLFFNPNIHPFQEYERRRATLMCFGEREQLPIMVDDTYPLELFLSRTLANIQNRCQACYELRLDYTVQIAQTHRFDAFTTTLLYSKFQRHEVIKEVAESLAVRYGIPFLYRDFRRGWKEGVEQSRAMGLYRQQYCGCLFSERERFQPRKV